MTSTITVTVPFTDENLKIISKLNTSIEHTYNEAPAKGEPVDEVQGVNADKPKSKAKPAKKAETTKADTETTSEAVTKADVRALALKLSKAGKADEIKAIFANFGGSKLSDINESDYPELKKQLEEAGAEIDG